MKIESFIYDLEMMAGPDCTPAIAAVSFRRAKKAGWKGLWGIRDKKYGLPFSLREQWQLVVTKGREQALGWCED